MRVLTIGGGEPFLYPFLPDMVRAAKQAGLFVHVDTNAIALRQTPATASLIEEAINLLGLPLDGPNSRIHGMMRSSPGHFDVLMKRLSWLEPYLGKIKINTIVTASNVAALPELGQLVDRLGPVRWSLYQYWPLSLGAKAHLLHSIDQQSFMSAVDALGSLEHVHVEANPLPSRRLTYPFVSHEGVLYIHSLSSLGDYERLGSLFDDAVVSEMFSRCGPERGEAQERYHRGGVPTMLADAAFQKRQSDDSESS
jgi:molybdenum cofactor biosynthesis enzyme MoaA